MLNLLTFTPPFKNSLREVFVTFLKLGLTSFGGPSAHLGYFEYEFVTKRRWLTARDYAQTVSLSQLLPGPGSSQTGLALGYYRAGWLGALAAWLAFTAPSALIMILLGVGLLQLPESFQWHLEATVVGIHIAVIAIVFNAVLTMWKGLCKTTLHKVLACLTALYLIISTGTETQLLALIMAGVVGMGQRWLWPTAAAENSHSNRLQLSLPTSRQGLSLLLLFSALFCVSVWPLTAQNESLTQALSFYQSGALVFGGGHVVLPMLQSAFVDTGAITNETFIVGYGAAQAVPGPLFSFGGFVGAAMAWPLQGLAGGLLGLTLLFLPGCLLMLAALPFYHSMTASPIFKTLIAALSASVVGMLLATLLQSTLDVGWQGTLASGLAWLVLYKFRLNPLWLILCCAVLSWAFQFTQ